MHAAYLARLGLPGDLAPTADTLRSVHAAHLQRVPFENLSIHLGEPIVLDAEQLTHKIVGRERGGFCYELNGAFAALLRALGFSVDHLAARVVGEGRLNPPFDHMALRVHAQREPTMWLADVGFGASFLHPLRLEEREDQQDPLGRFRLVDADHGDLDLHRDGQWQYRLETRARDLSEFAPTCWYQRTSPESHFTRGPTCSRALADGGRITLAGRRFIRTAPDGERTEEDLKDDAAILGAYRDHFGIVLDRVPATDRAL